MVATKDILSRPKIGEMVLNDGTPKKAFMTAVVVGSILVGINHGDIILNGEVPATWKISLTYCVPYCVTTWGAVIGKLSQWRSTCGQNLSEKRK